MVRIEPDTRDWLEALVLGDDVFTERFGIEVEPEWTAEFVGIARWGLEQLDAGVPGAWGIHLFFAEDGALVGNGGWKGVPVDGVAELGYAVAPARRGQGIATSVVHQLLRDARHRGLRLVVAHTLPERSASTTVLARCGFAHAGDGADPEVGSVWRWERSLLDDDPGEVVG
jgi:RimJ/RimL family protein N-acetyltransferase